MDKGAPSSSRRHQRRWGGRIEGAAPDLSSAAMVSLLADQLPVVVVADIAGFSSCVDSRPSSISSPPTTSAASHEWELHCRGQGRAHRGCRPRGPPPPQAARSCCPCSSLAPRACRRRPRCYWWVHRGHPHSSDLCACELEGDPA